MKRCFLILLSTLLLLTTTLPLVGCADTSLDTGAFLPAAKEILRRAETVNTIWFTEAGIPEKDGGYTYGKYKEIDKQALQKMGFQSLDAIKEETRLLFDSDTYLHIDSLIFKPDEYETGAVKRYIEHKTIPEDDEEESVVTLMRYVGERDYLSDIVHFHIDSLSVLRVENRRGKKLITVTVDITVENEDGKTKTIPKEEFLFTEEDGRFCLAGLICVPYTES